MASESLELFYSPFSQPSRAALWLLKLLNVEFTERIVNLKDGEHRTEAYKKINFMCKVPAIRHGDFTLAESFAILSYIVKTFGQGTHWYPEDLRVQGKMLEYIAWHLSSLQKTCGGWVFNAVFAATKNEELIAEKKQALLASLDVMEEYYLRDGEFISGDQPTIADLMAACDVAQLHLVDFSMEGRPKLKAWFDRMRKLAHYDDVHQTIMARKKSSF